VLPRWQPDSKNQIRILLLVFILLFIAPFLLSNLSIVFPFLFTHFRGPPAKQSLCAPSILITDDSLFKEVSQVDSNYPTIIQLIQKPTQVEPRKQDQERANKDINDNCRLSRP